MRKILRPIAGFFLLLATLPIVAQTAGMVTVSGTHITDSKGQPLASGVISFSPVSNTGSPISFKISGKGQSMSTPVTAIVVNGAFTITLPDTNLTKPQNVCFAVKLTANSKTGLSTGYNCVQPAATSDWCTASVCNFDNFTPNLAGQAIIQTGPQGPAGPPVDPSTALVVASVAPSNKLYKNRADVIDVIADSNGTITGAGNSSNCAYNVVPNYSGCHDDGPALAALFAASTTSKHTLFFRDTTNIVNGCDYYSSVPLVLAPNVTLESTIKNHFAANTPGGSTVSICFAPGISGIKAGQSSSGSGLTLFGGNPWNAANLATYVVPTRYGGTGPNADGLIVSGNNHWSHMNVYGFAGDCIRADSALTGSSDSAKIEDSFATQCRGAGVVSAGADGQVGIRGNNYAKSNQIYGMLDYSFYGNLYESGNTTNNHDALLPTTAWTPLNGTISSIVCAASTASPTGISCTATMTASNTLHTNLYAPNPFDLSANDRIFMTGTLDAGLNSKVIWITGQTATTFTFNYTAVETLTTGGTVVVDPGQDVWAAIGVRGGGWGVGNPLISSGGVGGGASEFDNIYAESTDAFHEFTNGASQAAIVTAGMGALNSTIAGSFGGITVGQANTSLLLSEVILSYDKLNPEMQMRYGGYASVSSLTPTSITAWNMDLGGKTKYSVNNCRRTVAGNVHGWWYCGDDGANAVSNMNRTAIAQSDSLTVTGRTSWDGTLMSGWIPRLILGTARADNKGDMAFSTGTAAPTTGTWRQGDLVYNINFTGAVGSVWAWQDVTSGFSSTPTWQALSFLPPLGSATTAGIVKVDGTSITVDSDGTIHAASSGAGSNNAIVSFSNGALVTMTAATNYVIRTAGITVASGNPFGFGTPAPFAGTAKNLKVQLGSGLGAANSVAFTVWDGNTAEPLTCTVAGGQSSCTMDTTHIFAVAAGDTLTLGAVCTGTCGANTLGAVIGSIQIQ